MALGLLNLDKARLVSKLVIHSVNRIDVVKMTKKINLPQEHLAIVIKK